MVVVAFAMASHWLLRAAWFTAALWFYAGWLFRRAEDATSRWLALENAVRKRDFAKRSLLEQGWTPP